MDLHQLNEKDAVATVVEGSALVARNEEVIKYSQSNSHQLVNNNTVLTNNSAHVTTFNNCNGLTFGGVYNIGWSPGSSKQTKAVAKLDESVYRKTPTIKEMLESNEPLSAAYLDCVSANFGLRWREITILLEINQLFVDRMYEDNFEKGGVKEVNRIFRTRIQLNSFELLSGCFPSAVEILQGPSCKLDCRMAYTLFVEQWLS